MKQKNKKKKIPRKVKRKIIFECKTHLFYIEYGMLSSRSVSLFFSFNSLFTTRTTTIKSRAHSIIIPIAMQCDCMSHGLKNKVQKEKKKQNQK